MQYVRSISGSVSKTWNSINPATLSGAIDVIVVEQEDGSLACSPFHVRFGKFSLLRPYEKKVEFKINGVRQDYSMKLGEGGEAFFVFETSNSIPESLQTSPLVSPASSPRPQPTETNPPFELSELDPLDISTGSGILSDPFQASRAPSTSRPKSSDWIGASSPSRLALGHAASDDALRYHTTGISPSHNDINPSTKVLQGPSPLLSAATASNSGCSTSTNPASNSDALSRAINLSKKLEVSNIPSQITDRGDLMLDMTGYKTSEDESLRAELLARKILSEELEGNYDIDADEKGNLWIYSSGIVENATRYHSRDRTQGYGFGVDGGSSEYDVGGINAASSVHQESSTNSYRLPTQQKAKEPATGGDPNRNYAKTLRLTNEQLRAMNLKSGANTMSFSVNRAICTASMYYWKHDVPVVISDIDGTITKSDALGHVLNMIGRDWTHLGVAKLYTDISNNGYNILYLTSRSIGQADTTRTYLNGIMQDECYRLPRGPVIMSPDRTIAALRREIYLRQPEVFKMACLRDIMQLFNKPCGQTPFSAGFGNRLTDALSYRSVKIPSTRIFTINSNAEVILDLLSLSGSYRTGYIGMRELVDHFFPPVRLRVVEGGEHCTDFMYWREGILNPAEFSESETENELDEDGIGVDTEHKYLSEDEAGDSVFSVESLVENGGERLAEEMNYDSDNCFDEEEDEGGEYEEDEEFEPKHANDQDNLV